MDKYNKKQEKKFHDFIENMDAGVVVHGPDTAILYNNTRAEELLGLSTEQLLGKMAYDKDWTFLNEDESEMQLADYPINRILSKNEPIKNQVLGVSRRNQKDSVWLLVNGFPYYNVEGELQEVIVSFIDVSISKKTEKELHESEEKFRSIFEHSSLGKSMTGTDGSLTVNQAFCNMLGYSRDELLNTHWKDITHPEDIELSEEMVQSLIKGEIDKASYEKRYIHKNGSFIWAEITTSLLKSDTGDLLFFITSVKDISIRRMVEDRLKQSNYLLEESQKLAQLGSYILDFKQDVWQSSEVMDQIFGIDMDFERNIAGWLQLVHEDDQRMMEKYLREEVIANKKSFDKEYRIRKMDNKEMRWVYGKGKVDFDLQGHPETLIGTIQDISDRKAKDSKLQEYHENLEKMVKERTKSLEEKNRELDSAMKVFVGREMTIRKLQERIKTLESK